MKNFIENAHGRFGRYGGCFAPELLQPILNRVKEAFEKFKNTPKLQQEFDELLESFAGRPTPIYFAQNLSESLGGAQIWIKREDLLHGGAHKTNNVLGQALLAREMGAKFLIAETGAGQHGIATAMAGAKFKLPVKIFMGTKDIERQKVNVERMQLLGAEVVSVESGSKSLKDAINEAMRFWIAHSQETYYMFGTAAGPHPFPELVARFQKVIGVEAREQILKKVGRLPDEVLACVGGGSNAIGIFQAFLEDSSVKLVGVEPAGDGIKHGLTIGKGKYGCLHGSLSKVNCDEHGQIEESHSISAGLDYPGVSPLHAFLEEEMRAEYAGILDDEAVRAFLDFSKAEGIIPALESSHALAEAMKRASTYGTDKILLVNLSGRGDKDLHTIFDYCEKNGLR
ncbi:tryptophan synthase subunit beta [Candidatus Gracilibacteria bacterium]|nr:tryptophan synthase subunit beta [Candidatus Gracilibacteria bacterium]